MELSEIIIREIEAAGPLSFQAFMERCLYYPGLGYYSSRRNHIGRDGDFFTSTSLVPVFATLVGKQIEVMWHSMDEPDFTIVECGAGTGTLCRDILAYLQRNEKMYGGLRYCIVEKSPVMREVERQHLQENDRVSWVDDLKELGGITGCILSNELVDNFAVHQVVMQQELMEVYVDYRDGFTEALRPAGEELRSYLTELEVALPVNFRTEINLEATRWIAQLGAALHSGYVLTIDYGGYSPELYAPHRSDGTLLCYCRHAIGDDAYSNIGAQDITSHVNFSALVRWGAKSGLYNLGFTNQCQFLLGLGFHECLREAMAEERDIVTAARKAGMLTRTLLLDMGSKIKVLLQGKGIQEAPLAGFQLG